MTPLVFLHGVGGGHHAWEDQVPYFGGLTSTKFTRTLQEPLPEKVWLYKLEDGWLTHNERLRFPWRPFMGTVGTAPELEALSALTPFDHGGPADNAPE